MLTFYVVSSSQTGHLCLYGAVAVRLAGVSGGSRGEEQGLAGRLGVGIGQGGTW